MTDSRATVPAPRRSRSRSRRPSRKGQAWREKIVRSASRWLLALVVLHVGWGTISGFIYAKDADQTLAELEGYEPDELVELEDGTVFAVADLQQMIEASKILSFAIPIGIGVLFLACYFWSRRSPAPALITALSAYVVIQVAAAVFDPTTIFGGIILKVIVVIALVSGIRAAIQVRDLERAEAEARDEDLVEAEA